MYQDINECLNWVTTRKNEALGIEHFREVMKSVGNPQDCFKSVHVAGTNGKGSTVNYLKDILISSGYKVATFTSPHLVSHLDRIRIDGQWISEEAFLKIFNEYEQVIIDNKLNMFEIDMLIASVYFKNSNVDYAIIETGLGGRLDATNCISKPLLSIITTIGFDHTDRLGNTLEKIAFEKAGIIKENCPTLIGYLDESCTKVIEDRASELNSVVYHSQPYKKIDNDTFALFDTQYHLINSAQYQMINASIAISAIHILEHQYHIQINYEKLPEAIKNSHWAGRFETISNNPLTIIDGAHNEEGILALVNSLEGLPKPVIIIFTALKDKPAKKMAAILKQHCDELVVTQFDFYRAQQAKNIIPDNNTKYYENYFEAIEYGKIKAGEGTLLICGSLYFISEVRMKLLMEG